MLLMRGSELPVQLVEPLLLMRDETDQVDNSTAKVNQEDVRRSTKRFIQIL